MISRVKTVLVLTTLFLVIGLASTASAQIDPLSYTTFPKELLTYIWQGDWQIDSRATATMDGQGRVTQVLVEDYDVDSAAWVPSDRIDLVWSVHTGPDTVTVWYWLGDWFDEYRTIYSYDGQGRVDVKIEQRSPLGFWENHSRTTHTYDGENLSTQLIDYWIQGAWDPGNKVDYFYITANAASNQDLLSQVVEYFWVFESWREMTRRTYTYSGGLETEELIEIWMSANWVPDEKWLSTYNVQELQSRTYQRWDGSVWNDNSRAFYQNYDNEGRAQTVITQLFFGGVWENVRKEEFNYDAPTAVDEPGVSSLPEGFALNQNYPNPFNPTTTIAFTLPVRSEISVEVIDLLGRQVAEVYSGELPAGDHSVVWDGRDRTGDRVASGLYFYRLQTESGDLSRKMVLLK